MKLYYTGVGSRETPSRVQELMEKLAHHLDALGFTLRSGGAVGADAAFEAGAGENFEIFIPWKNFGGCSGENYFHEPSDLAWKIASAIHPAWSTLTQGAKMLHARNAHEVLGKDCQTPSRFLVYWAPLDKNGEVQGGTRTAVKLAQTVNVPCFYLNDECDLYQVLQFAKKVYDFEINEII